MVRAMDGMRERIARSLQEVRDRSRHLAQLNIELLKAELKRVAARYGAAIGLFVGAALFAFFAAAFLWATVAVALDLVLPLWAAMLLVTVLLLLLVVVMVLIGKSLITSVKSPTPEKAIAEAQATAQAAKDGARSVIRRRKKATDSAAAAARPAATADEAAAVVTESGSSLVDAAKTAVAEPPASAPLKQPQASDTPPSATGGDRAPD